MTTPDDALPPEGAVPVDGRRARWRGRVLLAFAGCDYLRRAAAPAWRARLAAALRRHGPSASASRVTTGNLAAYGAAEAALARFAGFPEAVLAPAGYTAPMVAAQAMAAGLDVAWIPSGAHPCLRDAARMAGLATEDVGPGRLPAARGRRVGLFLDGLGALDGRVPPLRGWLGRIPRDARVLLDDAHGVGTLGARGRGVLEHLGVHDDRVVLAFTLGKAFGLAGGVVAGPRGLASAAWANGTLLRASTPVAPMFAAVVPAAVRWMEGPGVAARRRLASSSARLAAMLGRDAETHAGPVFQVVPRDAAHRARIEAALLAAGILPSFARYPGGPGGGAFRFAVSVAHTAGDVDALGRTLSAVG